MRIRNRLALVASLGVVAGGLVVSACGGDDTSTPPTGDAGLDATHADTGTGTDGGADTGILTDTGTGHDTGTGGDTGTGTDGGTDSGADGGLAPTNVLYVMSNDPTSGKNAIYAYHRGLGDGSLTPITGSPFATGGTGIGNPGEVLGPDDSDYQLIASADHTRLFAANGGSDNISVFNVNPDGTLTAVTGSPFSSGGTAPVSLAFAGAGSSVLFATNSDYDKGRSQTGSTASYATLQVSAAGVISAAPGVTAAAASAVPDQLLPTPDGTLAFGDEFTFSAATATPGLRSFTIGANGALTKTAGDPYSIPADDGGVDGGTEADQLVLGMALNPNNKVLYVNFVIRSEVSVWTYDTTGALTNHGSAKVSGGAPCWIRVSKDGKHMYVTDTAFDQVSVLTVSSDGLTLKETQVLTLANAGPIQDSGPNAMHTASESYDEELSPDGKYLYVESERLTSDSTYTEGNMVHVLAINPTDGTLTEGVATTPLDPDAGVPITARTEGLVVF